MFAAGAFAAPHAFAAIGRDHPTVQDKEKFQELLDRVEGKLRSGEPLERVSINGDAPVAPYYIPLGEDGQPAKFLKAKPQTDLAKCDHCGKCARCVPWGPSIRKTPMSPRHLHQMPGLHQILSQRGQIFRRSPLSLPQSHAGEELPEDGGIGSILKGVLLTQHPFCRDPRPEHIASAICSLFHPIHPMFLPQGSDGISPFT